jgi:hypothetical protein
MKRIAFAPRDVVDSVWSLVPKPPGSSAAPRRREPESGQAEQPQLAYPISRRARRLMREGSICWR